MSFSKKHVELHSLERFKALLPDFPEGAITPTEEPDFLVDMPRGRLGIELTELHRDVPPGAIPQQASEAMRHRVVERAQDMYSADGHPPIRCTVFMHNKHIEKNEVASLASAIVKIAVKNVPPPNSSVREEYDWTNRAYFPGILDSVTVHRLDGMTQSHFNCPGSTWVAPLAPGDLERAIASKEGKYDAYRKRCEEAWLLINADIGSMSTWFQFDSAALTGPFRTSFQRVFVMRHFGSSLHELAVVPVSGA